MIHVGVDLHQRFCYMTALEARGKIVQGDAAGAGASAAGEGDCVGEVEERPGGFGDPGAPAALRLIAGVVEGGPGDTGAAAAGAVAGDAGAASHAAEEIRCTRCCISGGCILR